ncbi:hypothetical protein ACMAVI_001856 [Burkholderia cenocepacia]
MSRATQSLLFLDAPNRQRRSADILPIKARVLDGAIRNVEPYPDKYVLTSVPEVTLRSWRIHLVNQRRNDFPARYGWATWGGRVAYQSGVRRLIRDVTVQAKVDGVPSTLIFDQRDRASLSGWCAERLAIILLRCGFEEPYFLSWDAPLRGIILRQSVFESALIEQTLSRSACRALVAAAFLGLRAQLRQHLANGYLCRSDLAYRPGDVAALAGCVSDGTQFGIVAVPAGRVADVLLPASNPDALMAVMARINKSVSTIDFD